MALEVTQVPTSSLAKSKSKSSWPYLSENIHIVCMVGARDATTSENTKARHKFRVRRLDKKEFCGETLCRREAALG